MTHPTDAAIAQAFRECREEMSGSVAWLDAFRLIELRAREMDAEKGGDGVCSCPEHGNWVNSDDVKRLVRRLDVAINGENGAAPQASLCDIVAQVEKAFRDAATPPAQAAEAVERVARAIACASSGRKQNRAEAVWKNIASWEKLRYRDHARAAIA